MPKKRDGASPLPLGWDIGRDFDGKIYYIDHNTKKTTWVDPRDSVSRPTDFSDCLGDELPVGWEQVFDYQTGGVYYVDHINKTTQLTDPRVEWRALQEEMLRHYLSSAETDLRAKEELADIKEQRLQLAQDEFNHLNSRLSMLSNSTTSYSVPTSPFLGVGFPTSNRSSIASSSSSSGVLGSPLYSVCPSPEPRQTLSNLTLNSTGSTASTKYDPDLLKSDVTHARSRVLRLRRELSNIQSEMSYKRKGVETLEQVNAKFTDNGHVFTMEEAQAIRAELHNIQKSLSTGEQEKVELMKSLACLKDDLTRLQHSESSLDVSTLNALERLSTASQTDLSGEIVPVGARLAEMAKLRLHYDESRRHVQDIQQSLASLEERMSPGQLESDKDRLLLIQEKEQLLRELRSINPKSRTAKDMIEIKREIQKLEQDLNNAMEISNRCISDRLRIHEEKQMLLQQLKDSLRTVAQLESQLKLLSASTLSMSSSSSLGSLSSSHASSKGSLSSLSFTDIYGLSSTTPADPQLLDLHRHVEKFLGGQQRMQAEEPQPQPEAGAAAALVPSHQPQPSLSPRSSLSSVSPPVSPNDATTTPPTLPPSYEQAYRQRRMHLDQCSEQLRVSRTNLSTLSVISENRSNLELNLKPASTGEQSVPLSPISETVSSAKVSPASDPRSVSAAVSDESVAGDSGVFEAVTRKTTSDGLASMNLETAQVQIKLRYAASDGLLHVGIERARNLGALFIPENRKICVKAALLPSVPAMSWTFCTRAISDLQKPTFGENFPLSVPQSKLVSKTLQVTIWSVSPDFREDCLGSSQVSLADFDSRSGSSVRWYNILSFHFMQQPDHSPATSKKSKAVPASESEVSSAVSSKQGTLKEESSDESTIISSQTSTLTRNVGPEAMLAHVQENTAAILEHAMKQGLILNEGSEDEESDLVAAPSSGNPLPSSLYGGSSSLAHSQDLVDKETNTECVFVQPSVGGPPVRKPLGHEDVSAASLAHQALVKRSQTFSPSAPINKTDYICRLNRSDSDSAMPLYKRLPFQRTMLERRSLRVPMRNPVGRSSRNPSKPTAGPSLQTPMDLELDLAAQKTKLQCLQDEIDRLKEIKSRLEDAKKRGDKDLPEWFQEHEQFQQALAKVTDVPNESRLKEEKRIEKMMKKTGKDIYKLRKTKTAKGQLDVQSFKEKMAFFTSARTRVPLIPSEYQHISDEEEDTASESSTLKHGDIVLSEPKPPIGESSETVNALTEEDEEQPKRFSYEIDPEIGVIV